VKQVTKPRVLIGSAAFVSFLFSISLWFAGYKDQGMFVGLWVPSILALGAFMLASRPRLAEERLS
jgi:hypothetical protein